ncbi:Bax inhibitor-1 family protein [Alicyclobacillus mengziensis]|uniref:Bax inhibitor-1 family protein n=1 Tax=Alicyclobacillus mengziensis TaxID=2931921 RepID=A0A9X7W128_9BACL|nr:Bax inhibitor-1 family protein [Alicyclobacillus mengziensis]
MGKFLYSTLIALIVVNVLSWLFFHNSGSQLALSSITGVLFCEFILYDIQRAYRKKHAETIPMLVVNVYLDILNLFLSVLNLNAFSRK